MRKYPVGQTLLYSTHDFDGNTACLVNVTEVHEDHVIASDGYGMNLWIDSDTEYQFLEVE